MITPEPVRIDFSIVQMQGMRMRILGGLLRRWRCRGKRYRRAGDRAARDGRWIEAAGQYRRHLRGNADDAAIAIQLGHALKEAGDQEGAAQAYAMAHAARPDDAELLVHLGHLNIRRRRWTDALACFEASASIDAGPEASTNAARLSAARLPDGGWDEARLPAAEADMRTLAHLRMLASGCVVVGASGIALTDGGVLAISRSGAMIDLAWDADGPPAPLAAMVLSWGEGEPTGTVGRLVLDYGAGHDERCATRIDDAHGAILIASPGQVASARWVIDRLAARIALLGIAIQAIRDREQGRAAVAAWIDPATADALIDRILGNGGGADTALGAGSLQLRLAAARAEANTHERWLERYQQPVPGEAARILRLNGALSPPTSFSFVLPVFDPPPPLLARCIASLLAQDYPRFEICIADDASTDPEVRSMLDAAATDPRVRLIRRPVNGHIAAASNTAAALAANDFLVLVDHDDELPPYALTVVAQAVAACPDAAILFSDEDKIEEDGFRHSPYFKGSFDPYLMYGHNMVSHLGVYRRALFEEVGGFRLGYEGAQDYDLFLRCWEAAGSRHVVHIPHVLYHWRVTTGSTALAADRKNYAVVAAMAALNDHFARAALPFRSVPGFAPGLTAIEPERDRAPPSVCVIIPTRDKADLLRACIASILDRSATVPEIFVIDNGSTEAATRDYLAELKNRAIARVIRDDRPFNFSTLNNDAAAAATAPILCFLNNDTEILRPEWLERAAMLLAQPDIGIVGARLLYPDRQVQQFGVATGMLEHRVAGALHTGLSGDSPGYFGKARLLQQFTAVTGACLFVRRADFLALGGFDPELAVAYNDVDLCLRFRASGLRVVGDPAIELLHKESQTRLDDLVGSRRRRLDGEAALMRERWGDVLDRDVFLSPNLSRDDPLLSPAYPPRVAMPWRTAATPATGARVA